MVKAYDCVQCALWAHKNHDDENEAFWMRKALKSYRVEREQIVDVGYYGEETVA